MQDYMEIGQDEGMAAYLSHLPPTISGGAAGGPPMGLGGTEPESASEDISKMGFSFGMGSREGSAEYGDGRVTPLDGSGTFDGVEADDEGGEMAAAMAEAAEAMADATEVLVAAAEAGGVVGGDAGGEVGADTPADTVTGSEAGADGATDEAPSQAE